MNENRKIQLIQNILRNEIDLSFLGYASSVFANQNNETLFLFEYSKNIFNIENVIKTINNIVISFEDITEYNIFTLNDFDKTNNKLVIKIYLRVVC